jgi:hypothetical protein
MNAAIPRPRVDLHTVDIVWRALGLTAALMMDACWMTAWLRLLTLAHAPPPPAVLLLWLTVVGATSYAIARLSEGLGLNGATHHLLGLAGIVLAFLLSIDIVEGAVHSADIIRALASFTQPESQAVLFPLPDSVVIFLVLILVWQRGATLSGTPDLVWKREGRHFRVGVLLFAAYILTRFDVLGSPVPELLPTFFVTSLLAISVARANSLVHARGGSRAPLRLRWMAGLGAMMIAATAMGVGVAYALDSPAAHQVILAVGLALGAVLGALFGLLLPVLMLFEPVVKLIFDVIRNVSRSLGDLVSQVQVQPPHAPPSQNVAPQSQPGWVQALAPTWPYIEWGLLLLAIAAVIYMVTRARRRTQRARPSGHTADEDLPLTDDAGERKGFMGESRERLGAWIRDIAERPWLARLVIRRIYAAMLDKAASEGRPRRVDETPGEFQQVLTRRYPSAADSARDITQAYELVRYGLRPEDPHVVERVRAAWSRMKQASP